jgi:hypothetical protein
MDWVFIEPLNEFAAWKNSDNVILITKMVSANDAIRPV